MFESGENFSEVTTIDDLQVMTLQDFDIRDFGKIGLVSAGAGIITSLLVLGVISILRTR